MVAAGVSIAMNDLRDEVVNLVPSGFCIQLSLTIPGVLNRSPIYVLIEMKQELVFHCGETVNRK